VEEEEEDMEEMVGMHHGLLVQKDKLLVVEVADMVLKEEMVLITILNGEVEVVEEDMALMEREELVEQVVMVVMVVLLLVVEVDGDVHLINIMIIKVDGVAMAYVYFIIILRSFLEVKPIVLLSKL
jgi:hypothetical protein